MKRLIRTYSMTAGLFVLCTVHSLAAQAVKLVTVKLATPTLLVGAKTSVSVTARLANGQFTSNKQAEWGSSKPDIAALPDKITPNKTIYVTALSPGQASIHSCVQGVCGEAILTVNATTPPPPPAPRPVTSVGVTVPTPTLLVGQTTQALATPRDSSGDVLADRVVTWSSSAPSFATVTGSGLVTAVAPGTATIRASADTATAALSVTVSAKPSAPPNDTGKASAVLRFAGPTIAASSVPASAAFYEKNFKTATDAQWAQFGPEWAPGNSISGYERAAIYYVWWARTGDTTYLNRAHQTAVNYRDNYLVPAGYGPSFHWSQMESLYLDWVVTGDPASRDAVLNVASKFVAFVLARDDGARSYVGKLTGDTESRIQARTIIAEWMSEKITGTPNQYLDSAIVQSLSTLNANGYGAFQSTCGGDLNYMSGLLMDALTRIRDQRPKPLYNALIDSAAVRQGRYLWSTQWRPADKSFNYIGVFCDGTGSQTSAPDLNGLVLPLFGWLGKMTGDATWFTRGDSVLAGMQGAYLDGYRQTSESYSSSFRYFGYRYPALVIPASMAAKTSKP